MHKWVMKQVGLFPHETTKDVHAENSLCKCSLLCPYLSRWICLSVASPENQILQATTQVGNEMLQKEIMKAYESKIRAEMENKIMEVRIKLYCFVRTNALA
jgi:hypothetical protein